MRHHSQSNSSRHQISWELQLAKRGLLSAARQEMFSALPLARRRDLQSRRDLRSQWRQTRPHPPNHSPNLLAGRHRHPAMMQQAPMLLSRWPWGVGSQRRKRTLAVPRTAEEAGTGTMKVRAGTRTTTPRAGVRRTAKVGMIPRVGEVMIKTGATRTTEAGAGMIAEVGTITKDGRVGMMAKILQHLHRRLCRQRHRVR